jgi:SHS2 domain-containing protein
MACRVLSHTADTGIEATADSLGNLVGVLCTGMFGLMASVEPSAAKRWVEVNLAAQTVEELVVDALSELLYHSEVENLIFCAFQVSMGPELALRVRAGGLLVDAVEPVGPPIKAVTYHDLVVEQRDDIWYGRVYFDV